MSSVKRRKVVEEGSWQRIVGADVSAHVAHTWDPTLRRDERLLVPMDVRALVVPVGTPVTKVPTVTAPEPGAAEPWPLPPAPFSDATQRARGIYLHFAMPDALTRGARQPAGTAATNESLGLQPLPDRFVVVRLVHGGSSRTAWMLEADRATRTPLADWSESMERPAQPPHAPPIIPPNDLTAVAGGDVAWAATVDAVSNRFSFYDAFEDLPTASRRNAVITYFVAGWWSRADLDPLAGVTSIGQYAKRLESLGWTAPTLRGDDTYQRLAENEGRQQENLSSGYSQPGGLGKLGLTEAYAATDLRIDGKIQPSALPVVPSLTLVHGAAFGVRADGAGPDLRPDADSLQVAIGPNPTAALAALLAEGSDAERLSGERLFAAFQMGLLETVSKVDGLSGIDEQRHAREFVAMSGGARAVADRIGEGDPMGWPTPSASLDGHDAAAPAKQAQPDKKIKLEFSDARAQAGGQRTEANKPRFEAWRAHGTLRKPRQFRDVSVPLPRYHYPADLALLVRGAARSPRHGGDGRFDPQGRLACRVPSSVIRGFAGVLDTDDLPTGLRTLGSGALPLEVDLLLREVVLTDPYRIAELAALASQHRGLQANAVTTRIQAEAALRYYGVAAEGGPLDAETADVLRKSSIADGDAPSPVASHLWSQPWVPLWCEWELTLRIDDAREGWDLGVVDLQARPTTAATAEPEVHRGRTLVTSSSARALAADIRKWMAAEDQRDAAGQGQLSEADEETLRHAARAADGADMLAGALEGVRSALLGLDPARARLERVETADLPPLRPKAVALPRLLCGGLAELTRLRVVDAFGRHLDVPRAVLDAMKFPVTDAAPEETPGFVLPPRLQRPSRLMLRLVDASAPDGVRAEESRVDQEHAEQSRSPLVGFLLPDHLDEALEFFDAQATPLGQLMHDPFTGSVLWEGAPGTPGPLGVPPEGGHPAVKHLTRLATGLIQADARARAVGGMEESALSALLRVIDTTLWTTDPFGATGTSAIAALVGRPIAVVRASLWLDVLSDVDNLDYEVEPADRDARRRAFEELAARVIRIRLGEVTRSDDGLLAYAIDDRYDQLRAISPDVRLAARESGPGQGHFRAFREASRGAPPWRAITHPYIDTAEGLDIHPGQYLRLTLLMVPGLGVSATSGLLPRKRIALARDWFDKVLEKLSPSLRVGPVLFDSTPEGVRMPKIAALGPRQRFTHKPDPVSWRDDPILAATQTAYLPDAPAGVREGWIRVSPVMPDEEGGS